MLANQKARLKNWCPSKSHFPQKLNLRQRSQSKDNCTKRSMGKRLLHLEIERKVGTASASNPLTNQAILKDQTCRNR